MLPDALVDRDIYGQSRKASRTSLYGSKAWIEKLDLSYELNGHRGCVNTLSWSQEGEYLVSGSDDHRLFIWSAYDKFAVRKILDTGHMGNIFSAKFMPHTNNTKIISCAGDRLIKLSEVEYTPERHAPGSTKRTWYCHSDMTKRIVTEDNPNTFLSCSEDGDIRHHDLRISHPCPASPRNCPPPLISYKPYNIELTTLTMTKANPMYLIVGGSHPHVFLHDRRMVGRDMQSEWGNISWNSETTTQCVRRFSPHGKTPTSRRSVHITACKFSDARPNEFLGSWSADSIYMFNIHDSPTPQVEPNARSKTTTKTNPTESSPTRAKRKRQSSRREGEGGEPPQGSVESSGSSLDTGRQPPPLRESSVSAETTSSLAAMSSITIPPESITSTVAPDALGRQLTAIRRMFFAPRNELTQRTLLMAHESVVSLLSDMRLAMYSGSANFSSQRQEAVRFVTAIGVVSRVLALKLDWPAPHPEDILLSPIRSWDHWIPRAWDGWTMQFIRLVTGWFEDVIAPNNILRELPLKRADAPTVPLVKLGGEEILYERLTDMSIAFERLVQSSEKSVEDKRYWGVEVLRALVLLLGDGLNFAFIEGAFSPSIDMEDEEEEEEAQTLLDAFEAAHPAALYQEDSDEEEEESDSDIVEEEDDTLMLRYGPNVEDGEEDDDDEDDDDDDLSPLFFFQNRRGALNHPERDAAKDVPIVSHRKAYSGHCNVQTIKDVNYFGLDDEYVMSGSDDGILFIWDQKSSGIVQLLNADSSVTNVMTGHPYHPILAASGIDHTVKIFSPEGLGKGLLTRQSLHDEYKIRSRNDISRQSGLRGTFLTRDMLEALAFNLRGGRRRGENPDAPEGCETM